uniref:ATP synthase complex subunit 8 n=1 Tax=Dypsocus coleoptratus TaxID=297941 RepID=A0A8K1ZFC0_9NEOP|nr:ATP synthase F0 subunit 8 [Dypsocus coleoptratus]
MPQMNPIFWTYLMFSFIFLIMLTSTINYFFYQPHFKSFDCKINLIKKINWKW